MLLTLLVNKAESKHI